MMTIPCLMPSGAGMVIWTKFVLPSRVIVTDMIF